MVDYSDWGKGLILVDGNKIGLAGSDGILIASKES